MSHVCLKKNNFFQLYKRTKNNFFQYEIGYFYVKLAQQ